MDQKKHWLLGAVIAFVIDIIFNLFYGFAIGGEKHIIYYLLNLIVVVLTIGLVFKFNLKDLAEVLIIVFILALCVSINSVMYDKMNETFANDSTAIIYTTKVEDYYTYPGRMHNHAVLRFTNSQGKQAEVDLYYDDDNFDLEENFEFNEIEINVTEKMGGFKYKCYIANDMYVKE